MSVTSQQASLMVLEKDSRALESQYGPEQVALSHSHLREHNRKVPQVLPKELAKEFLGPSSSQLVEWLTWSQRLLKASKVA